MDSYRRDDNGGVMGTLYQLESPVDSTPRNVEYKPRGVRHLLPGASNQMYRSFAILLLAAFPALGQEATITKEKDTLEFKIGNDLATRYHVGAAVAKPYFYPVYAPGQIPVTRAWPMEKGFPKETTDHVHQKSIWFCHGDVIPEGIEVKQKIKGVKGVDFWSENPGHGVIACVEVGEPKNNGKSASVATRNEWRTADGQKILDENRTLILHQTPTGPLLEVRIDLLASVCPVVFGDTKEGSMGVRVNDEITTKNGGHFYNANGKVDEKEIWGNPSAWCDYVGAINGKTAGIALFDDPGNKPGAVWHARGYGLMAANPFGRSGSFPSQKDNPNLLKLEKGDHLKLRYGVYVHAGDTKEANVANVFEKFKERTD
jgi:hypothetical protein